jgi:hypothetical protein
VVLAAFLDGLNRIFQKRAKRPQRPLPTLNAERGSLIRVRLKTYGVPSKLRELNSLMRMVEDLAFVFGRTNDHALPLQGGLDGCPPGRGQKRPEGLKNAMRRLISAITRRTFPPMHSNSALQCTPDPEDTLKRLWGLRAKRMIWERTTLSKAHTEREVQSSLLGDNGSGSLPGPKEKIAKYTRTKIPEQTFLRAHERSYVLTERGVDWFRFALR